MSVTDQKITYIYDTDNTTKDYAYPAYLLVGGSLVVQYSDLGNPPTIINYILGTDYTISGTANTNGDYPSGVVLIFGTAPPIGIISISRSTPRTQTVEFLDNNPFPAAVINGALDKQVLLLQDYDQQFKGSALGPPTTGTYLLADWFKNCYPAATGYFGWVCTVAGTPGTWKGFGVITS